MASARPTDQSIPVLLVEDNPADAFLVLELLDGLGAPRIQITHVHRLADALTAVPRFAEGCVLLDLGLPDAQGMDALIQVRAAEPNVAIVVLTGRDDEEVGLSALQEGAQDYLVKTRVDGHGISRAIRYAIERKRLDGAKSQFIARAAHELRTPLTVLAALGETLGERFHQLSPEQLEESLQALSRQGRRARSLISNLLDLSQIEMGKMAMDVGPLPLAEAVDTALEVASPPEGTAVERQVESDLEVLANPFRFEQVLVNLLTNAYRYGGSRVGVRGNRQGGMALLTVADNGEGVPPELQDRLFEPFVRGNQAKEGSGLGLTICQRLVDSWGGDIWYEPVDPHGAKFVVRLLEARSAGRVASSS